MKREVIIVLHSLAIGGAERHLSTIANYMADKGIIVHMLLIDEPTVLFDVDKRVKVVCVNQNPKLDNYDTEKCSLFKLENKVKPSIDEIIRLKYLRKFNKDKADYFEKELYLKYKYSVPLFEYIKGYSNAILTSFMWMPNLALLIASENLPNKVYFGEFNDPYTEFPIDSAYWKMREYYFSKADGGIFQTEFQKDFYKFISNLECHVVPNILDSSKLPERYTGERRKDIVNFCRLSSAKNLPLLIDAFRLLHNDYPEYTLSIYGEGNLKDELLRKISDLGLEDAARIYPFDRDLHPKIRDAAMFVSSSDREGISNSMLESLAIGLPCVCTDCPAGGASAMIEDHVNGILTPVKDVKALYHGMKEIIDNPVLAEKLSINAVKIKDRLKPELICKQMTEAIFGNIESY